MAIPSGWRDMPGDAAEMRAEIAQQATKRSVRRSVKRTEIKRTGTLLNRRDIRLPFLKPTLNLIDFLAQKQSTPEALVHV
jgi:hypothetical protein